MFRESTFVASLFSYQPIFERQNSITDSTNVMKRRFVYRYCRPNRRSGYTRIDIVKIVLICLDLRQI